MPSPDDGTGVAEGHDPQAGSGLRPVTVRQPLTRERIVAAAVDFIDAHGLPGLTMRRLGTELGVEAMALYRYIPGKDELLDAVVEAIIAEMEADVEVLDAPRDGWQDFLVRLAHGVRRVALHHPKAFPLVASRPPEAPWLRPPLRSLDWVESFLAALISEGFTDTAAVAAYRAYTSFLIGHLLLEVGMDGADLSGVDLPADDESRGESLRTHPTVDRLRGPLSEDHGANEFGEALEELLGRLALLRTEHLTT